MTPQIWFDPQEDEKTGLAFKKAFTVSIARLSATILVNKSSVNMDKFAM